MARVARESLRVIGRHDLRKSFRLRGVRFVATAAYDRRIELGRLDGCRVVRVFRLRPMTALAGNHDVPPQFLLIDYVRVATFANLATRMRHGPGRDLADRVGPVVSVLPETLWHDRRTQRHKCHHSQSQHYRKAN